MFLRNFDIVLNVHKILPEIFPSLFDINSEIRFISSILLEKILKISNEKFFGLLKERWLKPIEIYTLLEKAEELIRNNFIELFSPYPKPF